MTGLLSAMPFMSILDGTEQIKLRPMDRVIAPLCEMGAKVYGREHNHLAPIVTVPSQIVGGTYTLTVKSAQVKSALIVAGLYAKNETRILNTKATRDHTEKMLSFMGADIDVDADSVLVKPFLGELKPLNLTIPGDISSAAFLMVAGLLLAENDIVLKNVGINETRTGIIDALKTMGASITISNQRWAGLEPVADISVRKSSLKGATFPGDHIVRMIDEIPVLALAATQAQGVTEIKNADELKVKESNRIKRTVESLRKLGAKIRRNTKWHDNRWQK